MNELTPSWKWLTGPSPRGACARIGDDLLFSYGCRMAALPPWDSVTQSLKGAFTMHAMLRTYSGKGAKELTALLIARKAEVEKLIGGVAGLVSYDIVETKDGCTTITVCEDKAGIDRSLSLAKEWLKANAGQTGVGAPVVAEGKVVSHLGAKASAGAH